ncbi:LL-diaminopimelate aminotransferase [Desulfuribacillus alkaliarsenatis]|uniref:LL-diaminopimelate aminotransferase n=1 Tax=Desulfuribacillus alkaliarsenatis TaxID=766136 RepID=A0A1E5FZW8_9FIRM|nr:LL-diaminopimelate aminotransferase [Desulfuribacillus alkaliarsenatis]OEF96043.1 LL-diaminopimelate aminotransferase [Desulfuribacillus alkaliarsenatis]
MFIANRMKNIGSAIFSEMALRKQNELKKGKNIVDLSIGTPDLPPPKAVIEAMGKAMSEPKSFFYSLKGTEEVHKAITDWYYNRFNVVLNHEQEITTLMGSQDGLAHLPLTILNPGDIALVPDPGYPIYFASVELAGGTVHTMPLLEENSYLPDLQAIPEEVATKAKLMFLNYPSNPVSAVADLAFFEQVVAFAKKYNILVVHDLAYSELCFDGYKPPSFLEVAGAKDIGIEINSLSKSYNMAGARFGFALGNKEVLKNLTILKSNIDYGVFHVVQAGALAALKDGGKHCKKMSDVYQERRDILINGLEKLGWKINKPKASMFIWARIPEGYTSKEFAVLLLEQAGIVVIPGDAFGAMGEGYVRIGLVQNNEQLNTAIEQLKNSGITFK